MLTAWKVVPWAPLVAVVLAAGGCGSQTGTETESSSAAQNTGPTDPATAPPAADSGSAPAEADSPYPVVVIQTSLGNITVKLDAKNADTTVDNFLRYVESGHYNGTIFHQVQKDYVILGGSYTPDLVEKKTDGPIFNQAHNGLKNLRGTIAMARKPDITDSSTCQFFINLKDNPMLDHKSRATPEEYGYCVFGEVIEGMDVADRIGAVEVYDKADFERIPVETVLIQSIRRVD